MDMKGSRDMFKEAPVVSAHPPDEPHNIGLLQGVGYEL
jgi:hypothetical protein